MHLYTKHLSLTVFQSISNNLQASPRGKQKETKKQRLGKLYLEKEKERHEKFYMSSCPENANRYELLALIHQMHRSYLMTMA